MHLARACYPCFVGSFQCGSVIIPIQLSQDSRIVLMCLQSLSAETP